MQRTCVELTCENAKNYLRDNPEVAQKIEDQIRSDSINDKDDTEILNQKDTKEEITVD